MDQLDISSRELRTLLRMSNVAASADETGISRTQHLDGLIAGIHALLPFRYCVVLHERLQQSHTLAFVYQRGGGRRPHVAVTRQGDPPLRIGRYLQGFSRFGTFQNAFFWFHRTSVALLDRDVADVLWQAELHEGIAGGVNISELSGQDTATLVQLQYSQEQFAAKHLVFANLIARHLHRYFEQGETSSARPSLANRRSHDGLWQSSPTGRTH